MKLNKADLLNLLEMTQEDITNQSNRLPKEHREFFIISAMHGANELIHNAEWAAKMLKSAMAFNAQAKIKRGPGRPKGS